MTICVTAVVVLLTICDMHAVGGAGHRCKKTFLRFLFLFFIQGTYFTFLTFFLFFQRFLFLKRSLKIPSEITF